MLYFELQGNNGDVKSAAEAAERFVDYIAENSYTITLAVSPGADQDADREPIFHDACFGS
jgi:hypothetical protein